MVCCLVRDPAGASGAVEALAQIARASSPRVMPCGESAVVFDVTGLSRTCGPPDVIAREVMAQAEAQGLTVRLAMAGTMTAAWVLAHARTGTTLVKPGMEAAALAPLPVNWLVSVIDLDRVVPRPASPGRPTSVFRRGRRVEGAADRPSGAADRARQEVVCRDRLATFERWGIRTCADLAVLPRAEIHARMGPVGVRLHQAATGEDVTPMVPTDQARVFADRVDLEWPVEGLEPLSFVLARQCERLAGELERADRGAVTIHTTLTLVTRVEHARVLALPAPIRDAKVLRTLILLDLETHPPPAAIDVVDLRLDVSPSRIVQQSLLVRAGPSPEQVSTLLARLIALCGESRVGSPVLLDTHDSRPCATKPFRVPTDARQIGKQVEAVDGPGDGVVTLAAHLRRQRSPTAARVTTVRGTPVRVVWSAQTGTGGEVRACAGPWRTSGAWWDVQQTATWDRDEWDVELNDGAVYRLVRHRVTGAWEIEGIFD